MERDEAIEFIQKCFRVCLLKDKMCSRKVQVVLCEEENVKSDILTIEANCDIAHELHEIKI